MSEYKLWNCRYSFEVPCDLAGERQIENYIIAARDKAEALSKGNICLSNNPAYITLNLKCGDVKYSIRELGSKRIKLPELSLEDKDFEISAKLSNGSLEFIVKKR